MSVSLLLLASVFATYIDQATLNHRMTQAHISKTHLAVLLEDPDCAFCQEWAPKVAALHDIVNFPVVRVNCAKSVDICGQFKYQNSPGLAIMVGNEIYQMIDGSQIVNFVQTFDEYKMRNLTTPAVSTTDAVIVRSTSKKATSTVFSALIGTSRLSQNKGPTEAKNEKIDEMSISDDPHLLMLIIVSVGAVLAVGAVWYCRFYR
jgi:hypothetical protein